MIRGHGSTGTAAALHVAICRFDSGWLHQFYKLQKDPGGIKSLGVFLYLARMPSVECEAGYRGIASSMSGKSTCLGRFAFPI